MFKVESRKNKYLFNYIYLFRLSFFLFFYYNPQWNFEMKNEIYLKEPLVCKFYKLIVYAMFLRT